MATNFRPEPASIPDSPGVYRFRDDTGRVIYVGKAKSLRSRLSSYFQDFAALHPRTQTMVQTAADVDWTVVTTEVEALQLEYSWIKEYNPRFNIRYRDDKSYPYLAVSLNEEFPRIQVMRGSRKSGVRYFGPYSHAWAIRETVDLVLRVFPVRTCSAGVFRRARATGRPCLLGYIEKCSAPCVGRVDAQEHRRLAEDFCAFMAGDTSRFLRQLESQMRAAAQEQDYERAARLRDDAQALRTVMEKQSVVLGGNVDCDIVALAEEPLEAAAHVFYVRGGRIRGQRGWVVDRVDDTDTAGLVEQFLTQLYGGVPGTASTGSGDTTADEGPAVPREVLVSALPADAEAVAAWLGELRGSRVELRVPRRGDKRSLLDTVRSNAEQTLARHKSRRASDLTTRSTALAEIADALGLDQAPLRIECFDVSNLQQDATVASMVVFEDGLARKSEYRRFRIRGTNHDASGPNDVAAIHEVVHRRFARYLDESQRSGALAGMTEAAEAAGIADTSKPTSDTPGDTEGGAGTAGSETDAGAPTSTARSAPQPQRFAYPPNLVVVDGGRPQVQAAHRALVELGIDDVAVCGLAKRLEEVWLPDDPDPVILPRSSEGLYLLQRVRDEAHRFAIAYHRRARSATVTTSALDQVPGVGPGRRKALLRRFGSLRRLREATVAEISEVSGIGPATAQAVHEALTESGGSDDQTRTRRTRADNESRDDGG
ncbi:excinuclease ABC subunit UvrC [Lipingzhangella sp. LS1_29]|uniref:UvrABC system protein C n=1 Tax=Lipingzhangella rawalii TaxID=2055835 RepID=A0ABU2H2F0_9ACTN|nr:excinuclease ABC subunit UvrC [Lipingzhangella rawalii]MDS1269485.1 excinuclease ABC subunit UvrC [Lipingzhangella rawalii]